MILIDDAKERAKLLVQSETFFSKNMKVIESYWKDTAAVWGDTKNRIIRVSDFLTSLQVIMKVVFNQTKELFLKNASDSSPKLISYSSIFASNFLIEVAWVEPILYWRFLFVIEETARGSLAANCVQMYVAAPPLERAGVS